MVATMRIQAGKRAGRWLADQLGGAVVGAIATGVLAALVKQFKAMKGFGWAEALVLGFFLMLVAAILVAAALALWRHYKPLAVIAPDADDFGFSLSEGGAEAMESAEAAWQAATSAAKEVAAVKAENASLRDDLTRVKNDLAAVHEVLSESQVDLRSADGQITALAERVDRHAKALIATRHKQRMEEHEKVVQERRARLEFKPEKTIDWNQWVGDLATLRAHLTSWARIADLYRPNTSKELFELPERKYKESLWSLEGIDFPNGDIKHDYKSFMLLGANYGALYNEAVEAVTWG
jgi:hypothetical protein